MENDVFLNYWMDQQIYRAATKSDTSHVRGKVRRERWGEHSHAAPVCSICSVGVTGGLKPDVGTLVPLQSTQMTEEAQYKSSRCCSVTARKQKETWDASEHTAEEQIHLLTLTLTRASSRMTVIHYINSNVNESDNVDFVRQEKKHTHTCVRL